MKAFVVAMLAMGAALFLAALFWPDRPRPAPQQHQRLPTVYTTTSMSEAEPAQDRRNRLPTSPQPPTRAIPTAALALPDATDDSPSPFSTPNKPSLTPRPDPT